jgi:hypothetical protein
VSLGIVACGGSGDAAVTTSTTTATTQRGAATFTAVCAAKDRIKQALDKLSTAAASPAAVATAMTDVGTEIAAITKDLPKLNEADRAKVQAANSEFGTAFTDNGLTLSDAVRGSDAAKIRKTAGKLAEAFDPAYASLGCR